MCSVVADLKVIIVGNGRVGKTSLITRFTTGVFTNSYKKTYPFRNPSSPVRRDFLQNVQIEKTLVRCGKCLDVNR